VDKDQTPTVRALFHWVPHFDRNRVMCVYENHVHAFKRTKPLVGNYPAVNGTVYFGDGAYGAIPSSSCKYDEVAIFEIMSKQNNMWVAYIS